MASIRLSSDFTMPKFRSHIFRVVWLALWVTKMSYRHIRPRLCRLCSLPTCVRFHFASRFLHPSTRAVRTLLQPCFKTGVKTAFRQYPYVFTLASDDRLFHNACIAYTLCFTFTSFPTHFPRHLPPAPDQAICVSMPRASTSLNLEACYDRRPYWLTRGINALHVTALLSLPSILAISRSFHSRFRVLFHLSFTLLVCYRSLSVFSLRKKDICDFGLQSQTTRLVACHHNGSNQRIQTGLQPSMALSSNSFFRSRSRDHIL